MTVTRRAFIVEIKSIHSLIDAIEDDIYIAHTDAFNIYR